jgi:hypothetical protein
MPKTMEEDNKWRSDFARHVLEELKETKGFSSQSGEMTSVLSQILSK